jgi:hypothetical protein
MELEPTPSTKVEVAPVLRTVEVIGRAAWGAAAQIGDLAAHTIERITVHHTASALTDNTRVPARILGYQSFHQDVGFVDLAYHMLIDANGNVYQARDSAIPGETFTNYDPTGHFLPVLDGNFDEQEVPQAQYEALIDVVAWASVEFGVGVDTIAGHRDFAATACPGASLYASIIDGTLQHRVDERLATGGVQLATLDPTAGAARIADVAAGQA